MSEFEKSTEEITFTVENHVGVVTLHRPAALNALSFQMICAMRRQLLDWQADDRIAAGARLQVELQQQIITIAAHCGHGRP